MTTTDAPQIQRERKHWNITAGTSGGLEWFSITISDECIDDGTIGVRGSSATGVGYRSTLPLGARRVKSTFSQAVDESREESNPGRIQARKSRARLFEMFGNLHIKKIGSQSIHS